MREHEIYDRLSIVEEKLNIRPSSIFLNILSLTYNFLLNKFDIVEKRAETLSMDTKTPNVFYELFRGIAYLNRGALLDANIVFKYVLNIDPELHYGYMFKGYVNMAEGKNAQELFEKTVALAPANEKETILHLTNAKEDEKLKIILSEENLDRREFIDILKELQKTNKDSIILKTSLAEAYFRAQETEKAQTLLQEILITYPDYPRILYLLGRIYDERLNNPTKANEFYRKVLEINPLCRYRMLPIEENESALNELNELILLYKTESPILRYFEHIYKRAKEEKTEEKSKKTETVETEMKGPSVTSDIEYGKNLLREKKYKEALEFFLQRMKKP